MNESEPARPVPVRTGLLADDAVRPGETAALLASRCADCDLVAFPQRERCERCGLRVEPTALSTRATLIAHTEVIHPPPDAKVEVPYGVGLVRFPEGISILGLLDEDLRRNAEIGIEVEIFAHEAFEGGLTYGYRRAQA